MFYKLLIVFACLQVGSLALAEVSGCNKLLSQEEFYKVDLKKCIEIQRKSEKEVSVHDALRESGKEIKNSRAPSVEVMYGRKSTRQ